MQDYKLNHFYIKKQKTENRYHSVNIFSAFSTLYLDH